MKKFFVVGSVAALIAGHVAAEEVTLLADFRASCDTAEAIAQLHEPYPLDGLGSPRRPSRRREPVLQDQPRRGPFECSEPM